MSARARLACVALLLVALGSACSPTTRRTHAVARASAVLALQPGVKFESALELESAREAWFTIEVPSSAVSMRVALVCHPTELSLSCTSGGLGSDDEDADVELATEDGSAVFFISRFDATALVPGVYGLRVAWDGAAEPRTVDRRLARVAYSLVVDVFSARIDGTLAAGKALQSSTAPARGNFQSFRIEVPPTAPALRIDLTDVAGDLDLYARHAAPVLEVGLDVSFAQHIYGCETLVIGRDSEPALEPGTWYVDVVDTQDEQRTTGFKILASFDAAPPAALLSIPPFPQPSGASVLARALVGVVEIATDDGVGCGTLVTPDGLVLTNAHVVAAVGGEPVSEVVVSVSFDPRLPPVETYRARVERSDTRLDLALLRITSGFYGQPLPPGYRFATVELGLVPQLQIGDPLWLVGYPSTGGLGSRVTIHCTHGVLSGFDRTDFGLLLKTDAEINSGNSGGAALDERGALIGLPTSTIELGSGQTAYVHPLTLLPADWLALIERSGR